MRHSVLSCGLLALAACTATGSDNNQHGPVFDVDASVDASSPVDGSAGHDVLSGDAGVDASDATDTSVPPVDAPLDTSTPPDSNVPPDSSTCASRIALVAGSTTTLAGASYQSGQWSAATAIAGGNAASAPSVVPFGTGFHAVVVNASGALQDTTFDAAWSSLSTIGTKTAREVPALAAVGASLHVVYQAAADFKFYHGTFGPSAWDAATDTVGPVATQSFGPSGPTAASAGGQLVVAQGGQDGFLYDQTWDASWMAPHKQAGTSVELGLRPTMVALNATDLLVVYLRTTDRHLAFVTRTAGTWSGIAEVYDAAGNVAFSNDPVALAPLANGRAVVTFLGTDGKPYFAIFNGTTWSAPAAITQSTLSSPPTIATGVCGEDAIAALVLTSGEVDVARLSGTTWSGLTPIAGMTAMKYAGIATKP